MSTTPPDDTPKSGPNPYEPPRAGPGAGRAIARGLGAGVGVLATIVACLVAFVATCFPVGLVSESLGTAVVVGLVAAGLVGFGLSRVFFGGRR